MALFDTYREEVREVLNKFPDFSLAKKIGLVAMTLVSVHSEKALQRRIDGYPVVDSVVVGWEQSTQEELERELKEILDEPEPIS